MSFESIAAVQARIAAIRRQAPTSSPTTLPVATGDRFDAVLARLGDQAGATGLASGASTLPIGLGDLGAQVGLNPAFGRKAGPTPLAATERLRRFVDLALEQNGKPYQMGYEVALDDPDPDVLDCSELVEWAAHQVGVKVTDGSWLQYLDLKQRGALMSVEEALRTPGALLFSFSEEPTPGGGRPNQAHVAISLGDGRTIEARGREYGVGIFEARNRFEYGGMIPEMSG